MRNLSGKWKTAVPIYHQSPLLDSAPNRTVPSNGIPLLLLLRRQCILNIVRSNLAIEGNLAAAVDILLDCQGMARHEGHDWLGANGALIVSARRTHADNVAVCLAPCASSAKFHFRLLARGNNSKLLGKAAVVSANLVKSAGDNSVVHQENTDLGVVLNIACRKLVIWLQIMTGKGLRRTGVGVIIRNTGVTIDRI